MFAGFKNLLKRVMLTVIFFKFLVLTIQIFQFLFLISTRFALNSILATFTLITLYFYSNESNFSFALIPAHTNPKQATHFQINTME